MPTASDHDKKLLNSGNFADLTVKCERREWKVHKAILSSRSEWFRAAICGDFTEAKANEIILPERDPDTIDAILTWIYAMDMTALPDVFREEGTLYAACAELYKAADFFLLDDLKSDIVAHQKARLHKKMIEIQRQFCHKKIAELEDFLEADSLCGLHEGLEIAYAWDQKPMKEGFTKFVENTQYWVLQDTKFQEVLDTVPRFGLDILKMMPRATLRRDYAPDGFPKTCYKCGEAWPNDDENWHWALIWNNSCDRDEDCSCAHKRKDEVKGKCNTCHEKAGSEEA